MLKRVSMVLVILILLCACQSGGKESGQTSQQSCGDGVCDGPENQKNCPDDCTGTTAFSDGNTIKKEGTAGEDENGGQAQKQDGASSGLIAEIFIEISVLRSDGVGDCGVEPWGVDHIDGGDYSCPPPKYWFGYDLEATAHQQVDLVPQGQGWVFSAHSNGGGAYQKALSWSDGQRVCEPTSVQAGPFDFSVTGASADGDIVLEISSKPKELAVWECDAGNTYERETTLLLLDWGMAVSGAYDSLTTLLTQTDRVSQSRYQQVYELDTNPSPENRDHVKVDVSFTCMQPGQDSSTYIESPCPW